jgi:hypothetical protein
MTRGFEVCKKPGCRKWARHSSSAACTGQQREAAGLLLVQGLVALGRSGVLRASGLLDLTPIVERRQDHDARINGALLALGKKELGGLRAV